MTGCDPSGEIDHRDRNRKNNKWKNLRVATVSQNRENTASAGKLPRGVAQHRNSRFYGQITKAGTSYYLGAFDTAGEAHEAYKEASLRLHGEFSIYSD